MQLDHAESANWVIKTWANICIAHKVYSVPPPTHCTLRVQFNI